MRPVGQFLLHLINVHIVVVHDVQGGGGRRGHPGRGGPGPGLADLLFHHVGHQIGHRPHALADLRAAGETGCQTDVDVAILIGQDPGLSLHCALADHRAGFHRRVNLIPGAVKEPGVDERDPIRGGFHTRLEVGRGAALLVHDTDLDGVGGKAQHILDAAEQLAGERDFLGPMHLRLNDVDRAGAAILMRPVGTTAVKSVHGDQAGEQCVLNTLGNLPAIGVHDGVIGH